MAGKAEGRRQMSAMRAEQRSHFRSRTDLNDVIGERVIVVNEERLAFGQSWVQGNAS